LSRPRQDDRSGDLARAQAAKSRFADELRAYPNVVGVGVGRKEVDGRHTETLSVRVYVSRKLPESELEASQVIPKEVADVPTDVIEDTFRIHVVLPVSEHQRWRAILNPGISIGNAVLGGSGTLGACVFDAHTGAQLLLSNWHVICGRTNCAAGEAIIQPGTGGDDTGTANDVVARLERTVLTDVVDAGVAAITGHRMLFEEVLGLQAVRGTAAATLGETASKSGRTTGVTSATVTDVDADLDIDYSELGMGTRHFHGQLVLEGDDASRSGDSGSGWLNDRNELIGLNFAGSDSGGRAIANPIGAVVAALDIIVGRGVPLHDHLRAAIA
jgi:hypothetical protein